MKPGIILPMGTYLASALDLKLIFTHFGKEVHHKDCQNFDAVNHLTSNAVIDLLDNCGYIGTKF